MKPERKLEDMESLLEKVEEKRTKHTPVLWLNDDAQALGISISLLVRAYNGSLDAAHSLHKAVFNGLNQYSIITDPTCIKVSVCWWPKGLSQDAEYYGEGWHDGSPARAWLIAIIKALIAEAKHVRVTVGDQ